jgi:hypothetical protein
MDTDLYQQGYEAGRRVEAERWLALVLNALALSSGEIDREEFRRRMAAHAENAGL